MEASNMNSRLGKQMCSNVLLKNAGDFKITSSQCKTPIDTTGTRMAAVSRSTTPD